MEGTNTVHYYDRETERVIATESASKKCSAPHTIACFYCDNYTYCGFEAFDSIPSVIDSSRFERIEPEGVVKTAQWVSLYGCREKNLDSESPACRFIPRRLPETAACPRAGQAQLWGHSL